MRKLDIRVVLVRSIYERNVGSTSRAMANMGFDHLILIAPQCEFTIEAHQAAANGQKAFAERTTYKSWDEFFNHEPRGLMIATTARDGRGRQVTDLAETLKSLQSADPQFAKPSAEAYPVHIVFGPEDAGLSADDIKYAHACCSIPIYGDNTSLNLSQAALLALFIIRETWGGTRTFLEGHQKPKTKQIKPANVFPDESLKIWLSEMGFQFDKKKINIFTTLRRMLLQNTPSTKEFRALEIVLQQSTRKLRKLKQYQAKYPDPDK